MKKMIAVVMTMLMLGINFGVLNVNSTGNIYAATNQAVATQLATPTIKVKAESVTSMRIDWSKET